eukprot:TRINITY_DN21559_c0_g1_i1.p1 TRINITY_DN21559_c0_g1~~TRINITY_DN21559_c0_g1_i1.p1  ORF type:complete len:241 (-),score=33.09 TRINITY_DN21559_c0_g1_i1:255-977(-)
MANTAAVGPWDKTDVAKQNEILEKFRSRWNSQVRPVAPTEVAPPGAAEGNSKAKAAVSDRGEDTLGRVAAAEAPGSMGSCQVPSNIGVEFLAPAGDAAPVAGPVAGTVGFFPAWGILPGVHPSMPCAPWDAWSAWGMPPAVAYPAAVPGALTTAREGKSRRRSRSPSASHGKQKRKGKKRKDTTKRKSHRTAKKKRAKVVTPSPSEVSSSVSSTGSSSSCDSSGDDSSGQASAHIDRSEL